MTTTTTAPKIWTDVTEPGVRAVKVNGIYVGKVGRCDGGWTPFSASTVYPAYPTFRKAAEALAAKTRHLWS